jgi:O-antigen/teichoic acid export membrane protein
VYNVPRGTAYLTAQQIVTYVTYLLFYVALPRVLTGPLKDIEVTQIILLLAAQSAFVALTQLGLPSSATRFISRSIGMNDRQTAGAIAKSILRVSVFVGGAGVAIGAIASLYFGPSYVGNADGATLLVTTFASGLLLDFVLLYSAYFIGVGAYARNLYQNALYAPLSRGLGLLLALLGYGVRGVILGWVFGGLAALALSVYMWHNTLPEKKWYPIRPLLSFSLPVFGAALIVFGQQYGDIEILTARLGVVPSIGIYSILVSSVGSLSVLWIPVTQALYPAISASHASGESGTISDRLAVAFRLTNLAVLPLGASLAAIAPTAIGLIYTAPYVTQSLVFAVLSLGSILTAQAAILTISLQAIGRAKRALTVTMSSTIAGLIVVVITATVLGPLGGAIGRLVTGSGTVILARRSLEREAKTHTGAALPKALLLAAGTSLPLLIIDDIMIGHLGTTLRLPILTVIFAVAFLVISRRFRIFRAADFALLKDSLPHRFHPQLRAIEHLMTGRAHREQD